MKSRLPISVLFFVTNILNINANKLSWCCKRAPTPLVKTYVNRAQRANAYRKKKKCADLVQVVIPGRITAMNVIWQQTNCHRRLHNIAASRKQFLRDYRKREAKKCGHMLECSPVMPLTSQLHFLLFFKYRAKCSNTLVNNSKCLVEVH